MRKTLSGATAALILVSCGSSHSATDQSNTGSKGTVKPSDFIPAGVDSEERRMIIQWSDANENCHQGENIDNDNSESCQQRDRLRNTLRAHEWCWGAPSGKIENDDDWHRCGKYDTDTIDNLTSDEDKVTGPLDVQRADAVIAETDRQKSTKLKEYDKEIEKLGKKIGMTQVMFTCGLRSKAWLNQTLYALKQVHFRSDLQKTYNELTVTEKISANRFEKLSIQSTIDFQLGHDTAQSCRDMSKMPFVQNEALFQPDPVSSSPAADKPALGEPAPVNLQKKNPQQI